MNSLNVPEGYQAVMPYLILHNAKDFMDWAMSVLDATEKMRSLRDDNSTIAHAELFIGESTIMVAEASEQWTVNNAGMFVYVANADEAYSRAWRMVQRQSWRLRTCPTEEVAESPIPSGMCGGRRRLYKSIAEPTGLN
ncbi:MAG: hypothetical protein IPN95_04310 [Bacteroidetes bacterium]|nr:hypothetical protein [Bacteroidota bacterium]